LAWTSAAPIETRPPVGIERFRSAAAPPGTRYPVL